MHILCLTQDFPPDISGGATRAHNAVRGLTLNGCRVTVITAFPHYPDGDIPRKYRWKPLKVEDEDGVKIIRTFILPLPSIGLFRRLLLFGSFLASSLLGLPFIGKVDVVWVSSPNILPVFPGIFYSLAKGCPLALNVDDLWPEDLYSLAFLKERSMKAKMAEMIAKFAYARADLITPSSPGYKDVIVGKYGQDPRKISVIRVGVDARRFKNRTKNPDRNRAFRVLYIGAFSVAYDFRQLLMAAKLLEERGEDVEFVLQGRGELLEETKAQARELGLRNLKIIDKTVNREEVAKIMIEADALTLPLRDFGKPYRGISTKLYEYQAVGKPIICCADGWPARYVEETGSGVIVKPGDYEALASAVLQLSSDPEEAGRMGRAGRRYIEENVTIEAIGMRFKESFSAMVRG